MRELESTDPRRHGAREGALGVTEELGLDECFGDRGCVEGNESLIGSRTVLVNGARNELLAGSGLPLQQHRCVERRY